MINNYNPKYLIIKKKAEQAIIEEESAKLDDRRPLKSPGSLYDLPLTPTFVIVIIIPRIKKVKIILGKTFVQYSCAPNDL